MKSRIHSWTLIAGVTIVILGGYLLLSGRREGDGARLEAFLKQELPSIRQVSLYSLSPDAMPRPDGAPVGTALWGEWEILGKVDLVSESDRALAVGALIDSLRSAPGERFKCFNPRHGIKLVTREGTEVGFLLCFECMAVVAEGVPSGGKVIPLGDEGVERLNQLLDKNRIPRGPGAAR